MTITATAPVSAPAIRSLGIVDGFDQAFERLVDARLEYEALRLHNAPTGAVIAARGVLHRARADVAIWRRTLGAL